MLEKKNRYIYNIFPNNHTLFQARLFKMEQTCGYFIYLQYSEYYYFYQNTS